MTPSEDQRRATVEEREGEAVAVNVAALRQDAERWRWAKEHPRIAVNIFDLQWMEQRDLDAVIDAAMRLESTKSTTCDMSPKTASVRKEEGGIK